MILKNILAFFCLMGFFVNPVFSQFHPVVPGGVSDESIRQDTTYWGNTSIKINPLRMLSGLIGGEEYGGIFQFPLLKDSNAGGKYYCLDAYIGGGLNQYFGVQAPNGNFPLGYTIRAGLYRFFSNKRGGYISLQYFFRKWFLNGITDYTFGDPNSIIDPISFGGQGDPDYRYNGTVNINCFDLVYGSQIVKSHHVIIDLYVGLGVRIKNIQQTIIGDYDGSIEDYTPRATPFSLPNETDTYPDIKLGFMIGFIL